MSWIVIENLKPASGAASPLAPDHVRVKPRIVGLRSGKVARYIEVRLSAASARKIGLQGEAPRIAMMLGGGERAGMIGLVAANDTGTFVARPFKKAPGSYVFTINAASADGLFSLDFPQFDVEAAPFFPEGANGQKGIAFQASAAMLAVED